MNEKCNMLYIIIRLRQHVMRVRRPLNSKLQYISSVERRKEYKKGKKVFEFYNRTPVVQYNIL